MLSLRRKGMLRWFGEQEDFEEIGDNEFSLRLLCKISLHLRALKNYR